MQILMAHNYYQQPGGEDKSFAMESGLLEQHGHKVERFVIHNDQINQMGSFAVAKATVWNNSSYQQFRKVFQEQRYDLVHFQNTFPLISPAAYWAADAAKVPVIQSLRNYRLLCTNSYLLRNNSVCESCVNKFFAWPGIIHACYRDNRAASAVVATMQTFHKLISTWTQKVDAYIALTEFSKQKFIEAGLPAEKIYVKPNFLAPDPGLSDHKEDYAIFVGRLSPEKGVFTLLKAWRQLPKIPLRILGAGPSQDKMVAYIQRNKMENVKFFGYQKAEHVLEQMKNARILVFPSEWYEGFPRTIIEAMACGTPIIASQLGAMEEVLTHKKTGFLFTPGDEQSLHEQIEFAWSSPKMLQEITQNAREMYLQKFAAEINYQLSMAIYDMVLA